MEDGDHGVVTELVPLAVSQQQEAPHEEHTQELDLATTQHPNTTERIAPHLQNRRLRVHLPATVLVSIYLMLLPNTH